MHYLPHLLLNFRPLKINYEDFIPELLNSEPWASFMVCYLTRISAVDERAHYFSRGYRVTIPTTGPGNVVPDRIGTRIQWLSN